MELSTGQSIAYFCGRCGSPSVEYGTLTGSDAKCHACGWSGKTEQLMQHAFVQEHGSDDNILRGMMNDMRKVYVASATEMTTFLYKWGFVTGLNTQEIARYLAAASSATIQAVVKVRQEIEKERVSGS